jgi:hypothetical protein
MGIQALDADRVATYQASIEEAMSRATTEQVAQGVGWYAEAREVAARVARNRGVTLEAGACIIAALSPRKPWERNISEAIEYSLGVDPRTMLGQITACDRIVEADNAGLDPFDAVVVEGSTAMKTPSFARNIAGDQSAVTVDVWMMKAAGITDRDAPTVVQYREISEAVRLIALDRGLEPAQVQAIAWIGARGSAE